MEDQIIEIKIKTPNDRKSVKVKADATVKELRTEISKLFEVTEDRLCLIFAGKILKDEDSLPNSKIVDGVTVHLVVKQSAQQTSRSPETQPTPTPSQPTVNLNPNQPPLNPLGNFPTDIFGMLGNFGGGSNLEEMQRNMQQQLMSNPDMLRSMLDNPMMQQILQSPEILQSMMNSNPQIRQIMERNPELAQILNNPSLMRHTMEMMRNPAMMQELMRHHDRALLNVEAFPGGMNHLTRLYRDIQEPLLDATTASNPFASLANRSSSSSATRLGTENNEPLPNPWSSGSTTTATTTATSTPISNTSSDARNTPNATDGTSSQHMPSAESLQNLLGNFNDPRIQSIMDMLRSNPQFTEMALANSPVSTNTQLQEQVRNSMSQLLQAFERPEIRNSFTNPRVLQAIFQIQQGLQILHQEAPHLMTMMPTTISGVGGSSTASATTPQTGTNTIPQPNNNNPANFQGPTSTMANQAQMAQMLSNMMSIMSANSQTGSGTSPEQMYASQLDTMAQMGFTNRQANLRALIETFGDVNAAVNRILQFDP